MKRQLFKAAAVLFAAAFFTTLVNAQGAYSAKSYILMDGDTGSILCGKGIHDRSLIASTTKIMTGLLALEHCDQDTLFTVPKEAVGVEGSSMYLKQGETLSIRELLYGLLLHSGNDAAVALAIAVSGSVEAFAHEMNSKALSLGMRNSHFDNPNGLDSDGQYSTAYDLAILTRYAMKNSAFREIVGQKTGTVGSRSFRNHNKLLWMGEGIMGVKTGYTKAAGRILVSSACRKGRKLIAVTICDGNDWQDHLALYEFGFSLYQSRQYVAEGQVLCKIPIFDGTIGSVYADETLEFSLREDEIPVFRLGYPKVPFDSQGEGIGYFYLGDRMISAVKLHREDTDDGTHTETHSFTGTVLP